MRKLFLILMCFSRSLSAEGFDISFGGFNEPKGGRGGAEVAAWLEFEQHVSVRFSGLIFSGKNSYQEDDMFGGFSIAGFIHANQPVNPYAGIGVQFSDTIYCHFTGDDDDDDFFTDEECHDGKQSVVAIYPEIGMRFDLGVVSISPFLRRYFDTNDNLPVTNAYGVLMTLAF